MTRTIDVVVFTRHRETLAQSATAYRPKPGDLIEANAFWSTEDKCFRVYGHVQWCVSFPEPSVDAGKLPALGPIDDGEPIAEPTQEDTLISGLPVRVALVKDDTSHESLDSFNAENVEFD